MCFTRIYGFIFCDPKSINSSAIKNITRSGTTFTATRLNNGTFTFTQQDNNTTYANYKGATTAAAGTAGLVPAASTANRLKFLRGDGGWQVPTNTTYAVATASANGLMSSTHFSKLNGNYAIRRDTYTPGNVYPSNVGDSYFKSVSLAVGSNIGFVEIISNGCGGSHIFGFNTYGEYTVAPTDTYWNMTIHYTVAVSSNNMTVSWYISAKGVSQQLSNAKIDSIIAYSLV